MGSGIYSVDSIADGRTGAVRTAESLVNPEFMEVTETSIIFSALLYYLLWGLVACASPVPHRYSAAYIKNTLEFLFHFILLQFTHYLFLIK